MNEVDRRCLSMTAPWERVILFGGKRIENRPRPPPPAIWGQHVLLHTAKSYDGHALDFIRARWPGFDRTPTAQVAPGYIVGAAKVIGYVHEVSARGADHRRFEGFTPDDATPRARDRILRYLAQVTAGHEPWFTGPFGWVLDEVVEFGEPYGVGGGMLGLWRPREEARAELEACLAAAIAKAGVECASL